MVFGLFRKKREDRVDALYAEMMAQARQPAFYTEFSVPDTFNGRFDMLLLHVILVLYRLKGEDEAARERGRLLSERFFTDMDLTLREMGTGDLTVPKKIQKMADAYFGRLTAYNQALDDTESDAALIDALDRNFFPEASNRDAATRLAGYVRLALGALGEASTDTVLAGKAKLPDPAVPPLEQ